MISTVQELLEGIASRAKALRLAKNLSRQGLQQRSGVSMSTIKKFETEGQISLESLLKIAIALNVSNVFEEVFAVNVSEAPISIDELLKRSQRRQRGRLK